MFKNSLNACRFLNYVVPPYHYLVPLIDVHKQGFVDKLHVCLGSNLCSRVGVFACLWMDTSIPKRDGRCWNMLLVCEPFLCQSFCLIALCCLWAWALMYNRTGNACWVCGRAPRNDVFCSCERWRAQREKGKLKGEDGFRSTNARSLMWLDLYDWCSGLSHSPIPSFYIANAIIPRRMSDYQIKAPVRTHPDMN